MATAAPAADKAAGGKGFVALCGVVALFLAGLVVPARAAGCPFAHHSHGGHAPPADATHRRLMSLPEQTDAPASLIESRADFVWPWEKGGFARKWFEKHKKCDLPNGQDYVMQKAFNLQDYADLMTTYGVEQQTAAYQAEERLWTQDKTRPPPVARRLLHSKAHACLKAIFHVVDKAPLDEKGQPIRMPGLFQPGKRYQSHIRLSNGCPDVEADKNCGARGFAVKLVGLDGSTGRSEMRSSTVRFWDGKNDMARREQDFLFLLSPSFFLDAVVDVRDGIGAMAEQSTTNHEGTAAALWNKIKAAFRKIGVKFKFLRLLFKSPKGILKILQLKRLADQSKNLLFVNWFSQLPFKYGDDSAARYSLTPCWPATDADTVHERKTDDDYTSHNARDTLSKADACFHFNVQLQKDPCQEPVEDPWTDWPTPFHRIATIYIPKQDFSSPEDISRCESRSYDVWNTEEVHRPLGQTNFMRLFAYTRSYKTRYELNKWSTPYTDPVASWCDWPRPSQDTLRRADRQGAGDYKAEWGTAENFDRQKCLDQEKAQNDPAVVEAMRKQQARIKRNEAIAAGRPIY